MRGDCNLLRTEEFGGPCDRVYKDCCLGLGANSTSTGNLTAVIFDMLLFVVCSSVRTGYW